MDGFLPPVDVGGWLEFQRKRAQQLARERIAAANQTIGAGAQATGDWIGRAGQAIDGLLPDWAAQPAELPQTPQISTPSPYAVPGVAGVRDWAQGAADKIAQIGQDASGDLSRGIDAAQGIVPGLQALDQRQRDAAQATRQRFIAQRPDMNPNLAVLAGAGEAGLQAIRNVQQQDRENLRALTGQGPEGPEPTDLGRQLAGGMGYLVPPQYRVPGAVTGEALKELGATPEMQGLGSLYANAISPGGTAQSVASGLAREGPAALRYLPVAGGVAGAAVGAGTGIASGAPGEEVFQRAAEGVNIGTGLGELGADLAPLAPGLARDALQTAQRVHADESGAMRLPRSKAPRPEVVSQEELNARIARAQDAVHIWNTGESPGRDYVARLLSKAQEGSAYPGTTDWSRLVREGQVDPDALNRALAGMREEGLSLDAALARGAGTPEERLAALQLGPGGVTGRGGLTKTLLQKAVADLGGTPDPITGTPRPFVTGSEKGAFKAGRNEPPGPGSKKPAWEYVDKHGRSQWLSTPYEVAFAKQLDENPDVAYWTQSTPEAVMETRLRHGGEPVVFTPDFIIVGTDGRVQVVEIKNIGAYRQVPWRVPEKLREAEEFFNSKGIGFQIFVEDQLGRSFLNRANPEMFLPNAEGRMGVRNGWFVDEDAGVKVGRMDRDASLNLLTQKLRSAGRSWEMKELGTLSGRYPLTQEQYDEIVRTGRWGDWAGPERAGERVSANQWEAIRSSGGAEGTHPAQGGFGTPYNWAYPLQPEQGGYNPRWTPHQAYAEFNTRQRRKGAPVFAKDAIAAFPQMRRAADRALEDYGRRAASGHHGITFDPTTGSTDVDGRYVVSLLPEFEQEIPGRPEQIHPDRLAIFAAEAKPILDEVPGARVGMWYNSVNNRTYLDLSVAVDDAAEAEALGRRMGQYAIYDSATGQDVVLPYQGLKRLKQRPAFPAREDQYDALSTFGQRAVEPGAGGAPGGAAGRLPELDGQPAGSRFGGEAGDLPGGVPGAQAPERAGAAGAGRPGLGGLEPGGVGDTGDVPRYQLPVPYGSNGAGDGASGFALHGGLTLPYAASTRGEAAFDVASALGSGAVGYATAEGEDGQAPTTEQRLARAAELGLLGAGLGPAGRGLRAGLTNRSPEVLGITSRQRRAQNAGPAPLTKLGTLVDLSQGFPLISIKSLATNALGGALRTTQRFGQDTLGDPLRPDRMLRDIYGMAAAMPDALKAFMGEMKGVSAKGAAGLGLSRGGLADRPGWGPWVATAGTRANAGTDRFWATINEGGARARGLAEGQTAGEADAAATRAGDFASYVGPNSPIATFLADQGRVARDPTASNKARLFGATMAGMAPYVKTPERIFLATAKLGTDWATQAPAFVKALKRGDHAARREAQGRMLLSSLVMTLAAREYLDGKLRGEPPANPTERRKQEAQGAQWNTWRGIPLRQLGNYGQAAAAVATGMAAGERAQLRGEDPSDVLRDTANAVAKWALSESYLDDLVDFGTDVSEGRTSQAIEKQAASIVGRTATAFTSPLAAADPSERTREGFGQELLYNIPGGRFALPERIDPATGQPMRKKGTGIQRYFMGTQGREESPEGQELNRYGVSAPTFKAGSEFAGERQTGDQARAIQRASGSEVNREVRETIQSAEYRRATDDEKAKLLRAAVARGRAAADVVVGQNVARSPEAKAKAEWQAVPKYRGMDGTPEEIRRLNARIARAKANLAAAKRKGDDVYDRWINEHPDEYDLTLYKDADTKLLKIDREEIEAKYPGVDLGG